MNKVISNKRLLVLTAFVLSIFIAYAYINTVKNAGNAITVFAPKEGVLYETLEWQLTNSGFRFNSFAIIAQVIFTHEPSGKKIKTEMYYDGSDIWKFRFTPTLTGQWSFVSSSENSALNTQKGSIIVGQNPDHQAHGFIKNFGNKWGWEGTEQAFIPQYVMGKNPSAYLQTDNTLNVSLIDQDIKEFLDNHGFTGFHIPVQGNWFAGDDPDPKLYLVIETIIRKVHQKGGSCHIWLWGSDADKEEGRGPEAIVKKPMNEMDQRNLRYLAARLGPLPGWSMGYGYDVENGWATKDELNKWKSFLEAHLGWNHFLGARVGFDEKGLFAAREKMAKPPHNEFYRAPVGDQYTSWLGGDYIGYTSYRPLYDRYTEVLKHNPGKPVFEEDRFRLRQTKKWNYKDYSEDLTRRGLWHSAMAGGVANIWGNLMPLPDQEGSRPYSIKHLIKTYANFFKNRFKKEMLSYKTGDVLCLQTPDYKNLIYYREGANEITIGLRHIPPGMAAVAVDTKKKYQEIKIRSFSAKNQIWKAPYPSDWAIAVGNF